MTKYELHDLHLATTGVEGRIDSALKKVESTASQLETLWRQTQDTTFNMTSKAAQTLTETGATASRAGTLFALALIALGALFLYES